MSHPRSDIDRYVAEGLPTGAERALRAHLTDCADCRRIYDEELRLRRALAGNLDQATAGEEARLQRLVLERAGLTPPRLAPRAPAFLGLALPRAATGWPARLALGAASLAVMIGLWAALSRREPSPTPMPEVVPTGVLAARLTQARGVTLDGAPAKAGTAVLSNSEVRVAGEGMAELDLVRGGHLRVFPRSRLSLTPRGEVVVLAGGKVWCEVEADRGRFVVQTDHGQARVLGTSFVVDKPAGSETEVRVISGVVEVEDQARRGVVRVRAGQRTRMLREGPPASATAYDSGRDRAELEQALQQLGREIERGLRRLGDKLRLP